jgi:hypothetical protein
LFKFDHSTVSERHSVVVEVRRHDPVTRDPRHIVEYRTERERDSLMIDVDGENLFGQGWAVIGSVRFVADDDQLARIAGIAKRFCRT